MRNNRAYCIIDAKYFDLYEYGSDQWFYKIGGKRYILKNKALELRFNNTLNFVQKHLEKSEDILDLGIENDLSKFLKSKGYNITNTQGQDLDIDFNFVKEHKVITAFEIFEHLFAPFNLLNIASGKLIASVPLSLWFAKAYWNNNDKLDCHYHEFEVKQFNHLLDRTGWKILDAEKWASYGNVRFGVRPILRRFYKRYYIIYAEK